MPPEIKKYLYDILTAVADLEAFVYKAKFDDLIANRMLQAAVERKFEVIGEALNRISKLDQSYLNKIQDYKRIISFRNIIIHGYDSIDYEILWDAATNKIAELKRDVENILKNGEN